MFNTSRRLAIASAAVAFVLLTATSRPIPLVWDEGEYLGRANHVIDWLHLIWNRHSHDGGLHAFSAAAIHQHWIAINWDEGHPGGALIPIAMAKGLLTGVVHELTAARLGPILLFSAACSAVAFHMRNVFGTTAAIVAVVSLLTFPRLFSEAHFATLDGQLTAWWLMLWASDVLRRSDTAGVLRTGILAGLTSAAKFTGWLAWPPLIAARLITRDRRHVVALLGIAPVALFTFWLVNPPLWHHPIQEMLAHVHLNLHRDLNVPMMFLGQRYDQSHTLPWYNTIVWLFIVTPLPILILGLIGLVRSLRRHDAPSISIVLHWATLMIVRALPGVPPHDGIRLFLPAFGFWCVLAGVGGQAVWDASSEYAGRRRMVLARATLIAALGAGAVNLARYYPQTLSHYNLLVGGVRGASAIGMEPAYWWDSLDADTLAWLNAHTNADERVAFSSTANISVLHGWGWLRPVQAPRSGVFKWYVLQNRTAFLGDPDKRLIATATPAFVKYAGLHRTSNPPWDLDVPLLFVYSFEQYRAAGGH